jgi:hypothetical protein
MDSELVNGLKGGCPMEMFRVRRIPRWGDVAEQGSEIMPLAAWIQRFKAS